MANPTSNFGWQMPTNTDLVKDLPADFETFGQAVDTSMADLKGGTTGQILSKNSNTDMDFVWIANDQGDITGITASSPLTGGGTSGAITVGIQSASTTQSGAVQLTDSTSSTSTTTAATPNSVKSAYDLANAAIPKSLVDSAGDLIYATANDTVARLAIGTAGQVLKVNSGATAPEWGAASSTPTFSGALVYNSANTTVSNNSELFFTYNSEVYDSDAYHSTSSNTGRLTIPSGKSGYYKVYALARFAANANGVRTMQITQGSSQTSVGTIEQTPGGVSSNSGFYYSTIRYAAAGDYFECKIYQTSGGNLDVLGGDSQMNFGIQFIGA